MLGHLPLSQASLSELIAAAVAGPTVAQTWPATETGLDRRYISPLPRGADPKRLLLWQTVPEQGWITIPVNALLAVQRPAVEQGQNRNYLTPDRRTIADWKLFLEQTAPEPAWISTPVNAALAVIWPAVESSAHFGSYVAPKRRQDPYCLLVEPRYPTPWPTFNAVLLPPIDGQQRMASYLLGEPRALGIRVASDKTYLQQTKPSDPPIIFPALSFGPTVAQTLPAFAQELSSFRTPARQSAAIECQPQPNYDSSTVNFEAYLWPAIEEVTRTYVAPKRSVDVRPTSPNDGWIQRVVEAQLAAWWPAQTTPDYLTPTRAQDRTFVRQDQPQTTPAFDTQTGTFEAPLFPATVEPSYRTQPRSTDVRPTQPNDGWQERVVEAQVAAWWPGIEQELRSFRMADRAQSPITTLPPWVPQPPSTFDSTVTVAPIAQAAGSYRVVARPSAAIECQPQTPPSFDTQVGTFEAYLFPATVEPSYCPPKRSVDVRPTSPNDGWSEEEEEAVEATYLPAFVQELGSYRTPDRITDRTFILQGEPETPPSFDTQTGTFESYLWPAIGRPEALYVVLPRSVDVRPTSPNAGWVEQEEEFIEAQYAPVWAQEASGFRVVLRSTDVRATAPNDGWQYGPSVAAVPSWLPAFDQEAGGFKMADRAQAPIPSAPTWPAAVPPGFDPTQGVAPSDAKRAGGRSADRNLAPIPTAPQPVYKAVVSLYEAFLWPPIDAQRNGSYLPPKLSTDVRSTVPNDGWLTEGEEEPVEATYAPAWAQELGGFRTTDRISDRTYLQQTVPEFGWFYAPATANLAPYWPAIEEELRSYRMPDSRADRYFIEQTYPASSGWYSVNLVVFDARFYPPVDDQERNSSYVQRARPTDVRTTQPNDGWIYAPATAQLPSFVPARDQERNGSYRAPARSNDVRPTVSLDGWQERVAEAAVAKYVPTWTQESVASYRSLPLSVDVRPTAPLDGWQQSAVDNAIVRQSPALAQETGSYRTSDRVTDKTFLQQTVPEFGWVQFSTIPPPPGVIDGQRNGSYRTPPGPPDRLFFQTQPNQGWIYAPATATLASTWPAIEELARTYRSADRVVDRTFILQGQPSAGPTRIDFTATPDLTYPFGGTVTDSRREPDGSEPIDGDIDQSRRSGSVASGIGGDVSSSRRIADH